MAVWDGVQLEACEGCCFPATKLASLARAKQLLISTLSVKRGEIGKQNHPMFYCRSLNLIYLFSSCCYLLNSFNYIHDLYWRLAFKGFIPPGPEVTDKIKEGIMLYHQWNLRDMIISKSFFTIFSSLLLFCSASLATVSLLDVCLSCGV